MVTARQRSYRIETRRDYISGFDWRLLLTGPSVGGYGTLKDSFGGKYQDEEAARARGAIWVETGITPAFQTPERIALSHPQSEARAA